MSIGSLPLEIEIQRLSTGQSKHHYCAGKCGVIAAACHFIAYLFIVMPGKTLQPVENRLEPRHVAYLSWPIERCFDDDFAGDRLKPDREANRFDGRFVNAAFGAQNFRRELAASDWDVQIVFVGRIRQYHSRPTVSEVGHVSRCAHE